MDLILAASDYAADWGDPTVGLEHATVAALSRLEARDAAERDLIQRVCAALAATRPMTSGSAAFGRRASPSGAGSPRSVTPELRVFLASEGGASDTELARGLLRRLTKAGSPRADRAVGDLLRRLEQPDPGAQAGADVPFTADLTALAEAGRLDPVIGRETELARVIRVLGRHTKNHPVLVGPPGVGKTAIVESLAQRIVAGSVPADLLDVRVHQLQMAELLAATRYRGDLEERLTRVLEALTRPTSRAILFVDEIHLIVGAGTSEGSPVDIGNLLKPILSRGQLRLIGATTSREYASRIRSDPALERRLQPVFIAQPTMAETAEIMEGLCPTLERHHGVTIPVTTARSAALISDRLIAGRYQPDIAIDLLDEACALTRAVEGDDSVVTFERLLETASSWSRDDPRPGARAGWGPRAPRSFDLAIDVVTGMLADAVLDPAGNPPIAHVRLSGSVEKFVASLAEELRSVATIVLGARTGDPDPPASRAEATAVVRILDLADLLRMAAGTLGQALALPVTPSAAEVVLLLDPLPQGETDRLLDEVKACSVVDLLVNTAEAGTDPMAAILTTVRWLDGRTAAVRMSDQTAALIRDFLRELPPPSALQDAVDRIGEQLAHGVSALVDTTHREPIEIVVEFDTAAGEPRLRLSGD